MKAILRTNDYSENYQIVEVIKNPIAENNSMAHIIIDGKEMWTGGILCEFNLLTCAVLDKLTPKEQWDWLISVRSDCIKF